MVPHTASSGRTSWREGYSSSCRKWPPESFTRVFLAAVDGGLHSVPHAGEMSGPASIRGAIVHLKAERIGHGIRILKDPDFGCVGPCARNRPGSVSHIERDAWDGSCASRASAAGTDRSRPDRDPQFRHTGGPSNERNLRIRVCARAVCPG